MLFKVKLVLDCSKQYYTLIKMTKHIEGLVKAHPIKHGDRRLLVYCDFGYHQGMITKEEKFNECLDRRCKYLHIYEIAFGSERFK